VIRVVIRVELQAEVLQLHPAAGGREAARLVGCWGGGAWGGEVKSGRGRRTRVTGGVNLLVHLLHESGPVGDGSCHVATKYKVKRVLVSPVVFHNRRFRS
jgi:hypothetical protein